MLESPYAYMRLNSIHPSCPIMVVRGTFHLSSEIFIMMSHTVRLNCSYYMGDCACQKDACMMLPAELVIQAPVPFHNFTSI